MFSPILPGNDSDNDGLSNFDETILGTNPGTLDTDHDGLLDNEEVILGTNPLSYDTDGDTFSDYLEMRIYYTDPLDSNSYPDFSQPPPETPGIEYFFWAFVSLPLILIVAGIF